MTDIDQIVLFAISLVVNLFSAFAGGGAGLIQLPALWLVRWFGMDYRAAVAHTLVIVGLFWNGTGALTLGMLGEIHWSWLPALLLGSLIGGYLGAHLSIRKGNRWIKRGFETVTLLVGFKLILG
ncbi:MAG: sulfite exporter TauE/SafE family protein [Pseudomonadota bacterium]|nr:sulfite exporter TauE/SafE family protein [Pseudomonadota bacterium]